MYPNQIIDPNVVDQSMWLAAPDMLTAETVAPLLRISRSSVYVLFREPGFPVTCVRKRKYVRKADLHTWLQSYQKGVGVSCG